jgi:chromosome segregation ATPase
MGLRTRTALAEAARARGYSTHLDRRIRACRERLADLSADEVSAVAEREAVAAAGDETDRLREKTAKLRGELAARREADESETPPVAERFRQAARELSEAETSATAARQNLRRRRREARDVRDRLERRFELEDELANLQRRARSLLVDRVRDAYTSAVATVPDSPSGTDPFDTDPVTAALAVARVADFDAPVVLGCGRFDTARAASAWLGAPVVWIVGP